MACTEEKPIFKHYCRICKKGFMCGRALGGHMRAHGIGDESGNVDDDDQVSDWEDKHDHRSSSRRMYQLRTNPNRLKSCRVCENCGKEFLSWKSFLEHGKCNSEDAESLVSSPSPGSDVDGEYELDGGGGGGGRRRSCQWSKRKRSLRTKVGSFNSSAYLSSEDEDLLLAKCLVDLANARFEADEPEESCASASREEERRNPATFLAPSPSPSRAPAANYKSSSKGLFECKACKKVFNSHQALGGHRASHKKVKGCYAAKQDQQQLQVDDSMAGDEDVITQDQEFFPSKSASSSLQFEQGSKWTTAAGASSCRRKSKVHECTICHRIFSTGQALGGHKRCHWMTSNTHQDPKNVQLHDHQDQVDQVHHHQAPLARATQTSVSDKTEGLDLNLNLPAHHHQGIEMKQDPQNPLSFEVYTGIRLQIWSNNNAETEPKDINVDDHDLHHRRNENKGGDEDDIMETKIMVEDEADSKVKLEKLSELKGISISGSSSPWLQVGIGNSTTDVASGP